MTIHFKQFRLGILRKGGLFTIFFLFLSMMPFVVFAQFSGGDGSENNPYIITTAEQLAQLATYVNDGNSNYNSKCYKLGNDISLSAYQAGAGWIPIGTNSFTFSGVLDGNNKKITGLKINNTTLECVGLFGCIQSGTVKNFGVVDVNIISSRSSLTNVGGVVGYNGGNITNCYSTGSISSSTGGSISIAGGVVGQHSGSMSNCYSTSSVNSTAASFAQAGGVAGNGSYYSNMSNCYSTGLVSSSGPSYEYAGGVVGGNGGGSISNCAALNPRINSGGYNFGRIIGSQYTVTLTNNIAFNNMINPDGDRTWKYKGLDKQDGADITIQSIMADGTLGGRFTTANGWTVKNGKLPGLFGNTVDIPAHLLMPVITTEILPNGETGTAYSQTLMVYGNTPITWSLASGNLPAGLTLSQNGKISGTPSAQGTFTFTVKAQNSTGSDTKKLSIVIIKNVGIAETWHAASIQVFPNPVSNELQVKLSIENDAKYSIYNVIGKIVMQGKLSDEISIINVTSLASGIYYLKISEQTIKFVKE